MIDRRRFLQVCAAAPAIKPPPDYTVFQCRLDGKEKTVFQCGAEGPGVLLLHELPGLMPQDLECGRRLAKRGRFRVYAPLLFGGVGDKNTFLGYWRACWTPSGINCHSAKDAGGIVDWLRGLCREIHKQCGGPGIGAIGMYLTGALPVALMGEDAVIAPVLCQPSLPLFGKTALALSDDHIKVAKKRPQVRMLGLRFEDDHISPPEKMAAFKDTFKEQLIVRCVKYDEKLCPKAGHHSVIAVSYCDVEGTDSQRAFVGVIDFLNHALRGTGKLPEARPCPA